MQEEDKGLKQERIQPGEAEAGVIWYERYVSFNCMISIKLTPCRAQILHYSTLRDVNIYQVQTLTLMAAFQASVNAMPVSWLLAGQALRVAQDLGLHVSCASPTPSTLKTGLEVGGPDEVELRGEAD